MWNIHYIINKGIVVFLSTLVFILVSRMTPAPQNIDDYIFKKSLINEGNENMPWYKDYRYQSYGLIALVLAFYVIFS